MSIENMLEKKWKEMNLVIVDQEKNLSTVVVLYKLIIKIVNNNIVIDPIKTL